MRCPTRQGLAGNVVASDRCIEVSCDDVGHGGSRSGSPSCGLGHGPRAHLIPPPIALERRAPGSHGGCRSLLWMWILLPPVGVADFPCWRVVFSQRCPSVGQFSDLYCRGDGLGRLGVWLVVGRATTSNVGRLHRLCGRRCADEPSGVTGIGLLRGRGSLYCVDR
jgi:hypothetical protein